MADKGATVQHITTSGEIGDVKRFNVTFPSVEVAAAGVDYLLSIGAVLTRYTSASTYNAATAAVKRANDKAFMAAARQAAKEGGDIKSYLPADFPLDKYL